MPILRSVHNLALQEDVAAMTMREAWPAYVRRITAGLDRKRIAAAADMNVSGISRWLNGASRPSPEKAISFARGLNHSPIEALVAAGYLDEEDIGGAVQIVQSLAALSDDAVIDELRARLRHRGAGGGLTQRPEWRNEPETSLREDPDLGSGLGAARG